MILLHDLRGSVPKVSAAGQSLASVCVVLVCVWSATSVQAEPIDEKAASLEIQIRTLTAQVELLRKELTESNEELRFLRAENSQLRNLIDKHALELPKPAVDPPGERAQGADKLDPREAANLELCRAHSHFVRASRKLYEGDDTDIQIRTQWLQLASVLERTLKRRRVTITGEVRNVAYDTRTQHARVSINRAKIPSPDPNVPSIEFTRFRYFSIPMSEAAAARIKAGDAFELYGQLRTDTDFSAPPSKQPAVLPTKQLTNFVSLDGSHNTLVILRNRSIKFWISKSSSVKIGDLARKWE